MALLDVHRFPHPVLKQKAKPVRDFTPELRKLAADMLETMVAENGIGLAANQVGQLRRLVVMDLGVNGEGYAPREDEPETAQGEAASRHDPKVFVNPVLERAEGEVISEEGCLSVEDFTAEVKRAETIEVSYQTLEGDTRRETLTGMPAVCLQHEMDHLEGKLFIDHLPPLKKQMIKKRLAKLARSA